MSGKKLVYGIACAGVLMLSALTVKAEDVLSFEDFTAGADADDSQLNASVTCAEDGNSMDISFQTMGIPEEEYHTVTAYKNDSREIDDHGSICIGIRNEEKQSARMNFSVIDEDGGVFQVKDGCYVKIAGDKTDYVSAESGCFEIPAEFDGEVEISFLTMGNGDTEEILQDKMMGYGFVCVLEGGSSYHMVFHDMKILDASEAVRADQPAKLKIHGEETVRKPEIGISRSDYSVTACNMLGEEMETKAELSLKSELEGVSLSEDGCLEVTAEASEQKAVLLAEESETNLRTELAVSLERSWTTAVLTDNGYDASLAKLEEIEPIIQKDIWEIQDKAMWIIRGLVVIGTAVFFVYYIEVRRKNRRNS